MARIIAIVLTLAWTVQCCVLHAQPGRPGTQRPGAGAGLNNAPLPKDDAEKRILETAAEVERYLSVPLDDGRLIRIMAEAVNAKTAVEIGTSTGYSGLWFAMALRKTGGKLTTFEYDPGRAATARENFKKAGVQDLITVVEGDAHETVKQLKGPVDIVFIDADKPGYLDYLQKVLPLVRAGGIILAHNISNRESNPPYVNAVIGNPELDTLLVNGRMTVTIKKR